MDKKQIDILKRALHREKEARKAAEKILEEKSRILYQTSLKLEQLLDEKSSQLQGVFENIIDAYVVMDLKGSILKLNEAAVNLFGYNNIKEESLNVSSIIYKEDLKYAISSFMKLKNRGFFKNYEARIITKSKQIKWVHINASVIYDKNKNPIAAQGIVRDITQTKYSAELIEEQKAQLDTIVDNASFGISLTQNGKTIKTNKAFQKLLGYSEKEFKKLSIKDISFKRDFLESKLYLEKMDSGKIDNFVINKRYIKKDKSIMWAKTNVNAVRDNGGKIRYQVALIEDITAEREKSLIINMINKVAKSILGKTDIYEIAAEITSNIAEYLGTKDCVIYIVNQEEKTIEQIAAYGQKLNNKNKIIEKAIFPIGEGITGRVAQTGISETIEDTSIDKDYIIDGKKRFSEITVPILYEGKVIGIIDSEHEDKNYYTKSHLKTIENIASLVAMQLKSAINIRAREKAENKNKTLLKELEKSNDELKEYAHIVSHDLKSPLRSIYALTSWLKEDNKGKFNDVSLQNFRLIETTLEKMELLITDILNYSSIGSDTSGKINVNLNKLVKELLTTVYVPEHIEIVMTTVLPVFKGDITKLQQLFQNLISNAVKYNDKAKGTIEIGVEDQKKYWQFYIKDNGKGIEEKYYKKIFETFEKLDNNPKSSGIGLSIVKKIVELYDGKVWLESKLNVGTTFYFTLKK